jgi:hypothetical protein
MDQMDTNVRQKESYTVVINRGRSYPNGITCQQEEAPMRGDGVTHAFKSVWGTKSTWGINSMSADASGILVSGGT